MTNQYLYLDQFTVKTIYVLVPNSLYYCRWM